MGTFPVEQVDADSMSSSSTVMDLSGGIFYESFEEVSFENQKELARSGRETGPQLEFVNRRVSPFLIRTMKMDRKGPLSWKRTNPRILTTTAYCVFFVTRPIQCEARNLIISRTYDMLSCHAGALRLCLLTDVRHQRFLLRKLDCQRHCEWCYQKTSEFSGDEMLHFDQGNHGMETDNAVVASLLNKIGN